MYSRLDKNWQLSGCKLIGQYVKSTDKLVRSCFSLVQENQHFLPDLIYIFLCCVHDKTASPLVIRKGNINGLGQTSCCSSADVATGTFLRLFWSCQDFSLI